jgi:hypothetical protein
MLCRDKIISLFCILDDLLIAMRHKEDKRCQVSDAEVITTAFVAMANYGGHLNAARLHMLDYGLVPSMISESRFNRRLHRLAPLLEQLFFQIGNQLKAIAGASSYVLDSFPVPACDNIRIIRARLLKGKHWRGKWCSMRRFFYGVKVQVLTLRGIPVEFCITPGSQSDVKALQKLPLQLPPESTVYADSAYTDFQSEDDAFEADGIHLAVQRSSRVKTRKDPPWAAFIKQYMRKGIETSFSMIKAKMLRTIHAVIPNGFFIKIALFIISYTFENLMF